ncbi:fimbrial protein [Xylanibacter oryzae]|uniref:fimbrial protein n=1 Tax=Xylanibacter oryzae TaxID=185293 RepID=UPI0004ACAAB4|nr:fimbrial protein [Xylanibacter oryzae]
MNKNYVFIAVMMSLLMMTSCTSSDTGNGETSGSPAIVNLNLGLKTRSSSTTALPNQAFTYGDGEGKVTAFYVGLFDGNQGKVTIDTKSETSISTTTQSRNILVAANTTNAAADKTAFTACKSMTDFKALTADLSYTTSADAQSNTACNTANAQKMTGLPMFGEVDNCFSSFASSNTSTVNVPLCRLVARIDLNSLTSDFSQSSYPNASFIVNEIFMYNVNDICSYGGTPSQSASLAESETVGKCEQTNASGAINANLNSFAYLSSGALTLSTSPYVTSSTPYYFYVFPHSSTNPTKLVIKGRFKTNSSDTGTILYYPIIINDDVMSEESITTDNDVIKANNIYSLSVTIKGRGLTDPSQNIVPSTATVTFTVTDWATNSQTVVIK